MRRCFLPASASKRSILYSDAQRERRLSEAERKSLITRETSVRDPIRAYCTDQITHRPQSNLHKAHFATAQSAPLATAAFKGTSDLTGAALDDAE